MSDQSQNGSSTQTAQYIAPDSPYWAQKGASERAEWNYVDAQKQIAAEREIRKNDPGYHIATDIEVHVGKNLYAYPSDEYGRRIERGAEHWNGKTIVFEARPTDAFGLGPTEKSPPISDPEHAKSNKWMRDHSVSIDDGLKNSRAAELQNADRAENQESTVTSLSTVDFAKINQAQEETGKTGTEQQKQGHGIA